MKRTVVLGVCGGIAAYKSCEIVSRLRKAGFDVCVIMTENARQFVTPLTFETLSANKVVTEMFDEKRTFEVEHISLAKRADAFLVAPATANVIGKLADGIADDMLTTTVMATKCPVILAPAMNTAMYENPIFRENLAKLRAHGYTIVEPVAGNLACGDIGQGKMQEPSVIVDTVISLVMPKHDFSGVRVLITAGGTREPIDTVRYIGNRSSGKMGFALAEAAMERGARVTVVAGSVTAPLPAGADIVRVTTTGEMFDAVMSRLPDNDIIIKAAAPADYKPSEVSAQKLKSKDITLNLTKTQDIAMAVGEKKGPDKKLVVFAAESENMLENAVDKLKRKNADMLVANDVTKVGAGFDTDTNIATIILADGTKTDLPLMSKARLAGVILDFVAEKL